MIQNKTFLFFIAKRCILFFLQILDNSYSQLHDRAAPLYQTYSTKKFQKVGMYLTTPLWKNAVLLRNNVQGFFLNYQQCSNSFFRLEVLNWNQMESRNSNSFQSMFELFIRFNPTSFFVETFIVVVFLQKRKKTFFFITKPRRFVKNTPSFSEKKLVFIIENCQMLWTKWKLFFLLFFQR